MMSLTWKCILTKTFTKIVKIMATSLRAEHGFMGGGDSWHVLDTEDLDRCTAHPGAGKSGVEERV